MFYLFFLLSNLFLNFTLSDSPEPWQLYFQDPATPTMEGIISLHDDVSFFLLILSGLVFWLLGRAVYLFSAERNPVPKNIVHGTFIEIVWTVMPAVVLLVLAVPSFSLLYSLDELLDPVITVKAIGRQWYWSYELGDYSNEDGDSIAFDSYLIAEDELQEGHIRMLEVDQRLVLPIQTHIRIIVTSSDVLHCFAVPSFGVKIDACPGRLNQTSVFIKREGVYYGNCSELCGSRHAFMPIVVQAVDLDTYSSWVSAQLVD